MMKQSSRPIQFKLSVCSTNEAIWNSLNRWFLRKIWCKQLDGLQILLSIWEGRWRPWKSRAWHTIKSQMLCKPIKIYSPFGQFHLWNIEVQETIIEYFIRQLWPHLMFVLWLASVIISKCLPTHLKTL